MLNWNVLVSISPMFYDTLFYWLLLLLFVFNIYVLAVVITVISSVRRVITNDQRLTEYSRLYISNTFLSILAVPNKAVFCITPTLYVKRFTSIKHSITTLLISLFCFILVVTWWRPVSPEIYTPLKNNFLALIYREISIPQSQFPRK